MHLIGNNLFKIPNWYFKIAVSCTYIKTKTIQIVSNIICYFICDWQKWIKLKEFFIINKTKCKQSNNKKYSKIYLDNSFKVPVN